MAEETITISKKLYDSLVEDSDWRRALESGGVDNWEGYYEALEDAGLLEEDD